MFHWRGPYIAERINADPWSHRYMANVFALHVPLATLYNKHQYWRRHQPFFSSAVVCYSAVPTSRSSLGSTSLGAGIRAVTTKLPCRRGR
jgi:hypothetical protein